MKFKNLLMFVIFSLVIGVNFSYGQAPIVYMTKTISPESLMQIYQVLGREAHGKVAIKLHTGESNSTYYLRPEFIKGLVQSVNGTITETCTAYPGNRNTPESSIQVAEEHGFTEIADVDILDADGYMNLPVENGYHLSEIRVGDHMSNYDFFIILSHFKGHQMAGFGGALKNVAIGLAARSGKSLIHSAGQSETGFGMTTPVAEFHESMADANLAVKNYVKENIIYINVMNNISVDCDCNAHPSDPNMADVGILASIDPVALDQACVDLVYAAPDGASVVSRIESMNGVYLLETCDSLNVGSREYELVRIDSTTSVNESKTNADMNFYPNPANTVINIPNSENYDSIYIIDVNGRLISKMAGRNSIDISNLTPGKYFIQVLKNGLLLGTHQFIKE